VASQSRHFCERRIIPLRIPWPSRRRRHPAALGVSKKKGGLCENQYLCVDAGIACVCRLRHRTDGCYNYDKSNPSKADGHAGRSMDAQQERRLAIDLGPSGMVALTTGSSLCTFERVVIGMKSNVIVGNSGAETKVLTAVLDVLCERVRP
jgi:hypothetical protein